MMSSESDSSENDERIVPENIRQMAKDLSLELLPK